MRFMGMVQRHLVLLLEGLGVIHFTGRRQSMQVRGRYLLDDLAPRAARAEVRRASGSAGGPPSGDYGTGEQGLLVLNQALGNGSRGDQREARRKAARKRPSPKPQRCQVVLVIPGIPGKRDSRQECLQGL